MLHYKLGFTYLFAWIVQLQYKFSIEVCDLINIQQGAFLSLIVTQSTIDHSFCAERTIKFAHTYKQLERDKHLVRNDSK